MATISGRWWEKGLSLMKGMGEGKEMPAERRIHPRFPVQRLASVAVTGDDVGLPYHLVDISEGGMAFRYLNASPLPLSDSKMDIYMAGDLCIGRLPVTVVADRPADGDFMPTRHCGVRFGALTPVQKIQLQAFIRSQAAAEQHHA